MWLPYHDRPLVPFDLWRAEVLLICYEIVEYYYPKRVMRQFARAQMVPDAVDACLDLHQIQLRGNDNTSWVTQHAIHLDAWNQWRLRVRDGPAVAFAALSYPCDEYIRWYRGITRPAGMDRRMMWRFGSHVHLIHRWPRCMVSIEGTLGCTPLQHDIRATFPVQSSRRSHREHVPDRGARGVEKGARRHPGRGAGGGRPPIPPVPQRQEHVDLGPAVVQRGEGSSSGQ
ncbi:hypothetical protein M9H77_12729 [Catharanthus roseus]|uniref:Uncharacterized protein n=1 Tax=Catharanthus roseus TaxID=4058 RepID=A0ACC0BI54_CATRO|nr:hypothetical protein M9H77_12729 [Catharanthus roseus]